MRTLAFPLAAACLLAITSQAAGQRESSSDERESLAGLDGLYVLVEPLNDDAQEGGLTTDALQTYLEMRLRQARIPVMSKDQHYASLRQPFLYLRISVLQPKGGWAYLIELEVNQQACIKGGLAGQTGFLAGVKGCTDLATWDRNGLVVLGSGLSGSVREEVAKFMDMLVNDYLAVNP